MQRLSRFFQLFIPLSLVAVLLSWAVLVKVDRVECSWGENQCPETTQAVLQKLKGERFFFANHQILATDMIKSEPELQVDSVSKRWPLTLMVQLRPSLPIYSLSSGGQELRIATEDGFVITKQTEAKVEIPEVFFDDQSLIADSRVNQIIHNQLKFLIQGLEAERVVYQELEVQSSNLVLVVLDQKIAVLTLEEPAYDSKRLSLVLKGLEPDKLESVREIDLRYRFPVLRDQTTISRHKTQ